MSCPPSVVYGIGNIIISYYYHYSPPLLSPLPPAYQYIFNQRRGLGSKHFHNVREEIVLLSSLRRGYVEVSPSNLVHILAELRVAAEAGVVPVLGQLEGRLVPLQGALQPAEGRQEGRRVPHGLAQRPPVALQGGGQGGGGLRAPQGQKVEHGPRGERVGLAGVAQGQVAPQQRGVGRHVRGGRVAVVPAGVRQVAPPRVRRPQGRVQGRVAPPPGGVAARRPPHRHLQQIHKRLRIVTNFLSHGIGDLFDHGSFTVCDFRAGL
mmetsp:Transcript_14618/g.20219  ORF Transcript_14618/g.20219 Transcript_14618/m.20219 type:complete len:264 (-) Transcript_14618:272-1063(-)